MCCIVEVATLIMGIMALVKGEVTIFSGKVVRGAPAYIIGLILASTLPIALGLGVLVGIMAVQNGGNPNANPLQFAWIDIVITASTVTISIVLALIYGEDVSTSSRRNSRRKKRRPEYDDDQLEDEEYDREE